MYKDRIVEKLSQCEELIGRMESIHRLWLVGSQEKWLDYVESLLKDNGICEPLRMQGEWKRTLDSAQKSILANEADGIVIIEPYCVTGYEQKIYIDPERVFELPFSFFNTTEHREFEILSIFSPMLTGGRIGEIQFNLTDRCNLNCNLCSHFCPLVKKTDDYTLVEFEKDAQRLKDLTEHIDVIGLWGGEALLNTDLESIIYKCSEIFPTSKIELGTNGLLLDKSPVSLIAAIKQTNCKIVVSGYPPTMESWDRTEKMLKTLGVNYRLQKVESFFRRYNPNGNNEIISNYRNCGSKICHTVSKGRYSSCYFPVVAHIFNDYFSEKLFCFDDAVFDLYDSKLTKKQFCKILKSENSCCKYCDMPKLEKWTNKKSKTQKNDWIM